MAHVIELWGDLGNGFPEAGLYTFDLYFSARAGGEALKGEHAFTVLSCERGEMPRKVSPPLRVTPLQRVVAEPVTEPAEQAALDKLRKREKRKRGGQKAKTNRNGARAGLRST
jgi:hypothetical protein